MESFLFWNYIVVVPQRGASAAINDLCVLLQNNFEFIFSDVVYTCYFMNLNENYDFINNTITNLDYHHQFEVCCAT